MTADHLLEVLDNRLLARFDVDLLHDYRARRPEVTFAEDRFIDYTPAARCRLHLLTDDAGVEFLLLEGVEPDNHWDRFAGAVRQLIELLQRDADGRRPRHPDGRPAHPPTRPDRSRDPARAGHPVEHLGRRDALPASAGTMLQVRLGEAGKDAMGFAVHVPHYLAENRFPGAALALVHAISAATGLLLPSKALLDEAALTGRLVDEQVEASEDASAVVNALETQYDAAAGSLSRGSLLAGSTPSADELGAEVEQFLAELNRDDDE